MCFSKYSAPAAEGAVVGAAAKLSRTSIPAKSAGEIVQTIRFIVAVNRQEMRGVSHYTKCHRQCFSPQRRGGSDSGRGELSLCNVDNLQPNILELSDGRGAAVQ